MKDPRIKLCLSVAAIALSLFFACSKKGAKTEVIDEKKEAQTPSSVAHPRLMHNTAQIDFVKAKIASAAQPWTSAYQQLIAKANSYANRTHVAVASFSVPPFYTDPVASGAAKDGYLTDAHAAYANALAYALGGNEAHAYKAIYFLNAWASINTNIATTGDTPLVSSYGGTGLLIAADLLLNSTLWPSAEKEAFKNWVRLKYLPIVGAIKTNSNNWGDWATLAVISAYGVLDDEAKLLLEVDRIKARMDKHIETDGHLPQEVRREENGIWYTYFALSAMTSSARVAQNATGENLFTYTSPSGKTYKKALDYLHHYLYQQQLWPWHTMGPKNLNNFVWPVDLFEAMNEFYGNAYNGLVSPFRPVLGGYKNDFVKPTHVSWNYPTLMRAN